MEAKRVQDVVTSGDGDSIHLLVNQGWQLPAINARDSTWGSEQLDLGGSRRAGWGPHSSRIWIPGVVGAIQESCLPPGPEPLAANMATSTGGATAAGPYREAHFLSANVTSSPPPSLPSSSHHTSCSSLYSQGARSEGL